MQTYNFSQVIQSAPATRALLQEFTQAQSAQIATTPITHLVKHRANFFDQLLSCYWQKFLPTTPSSALFETSLIAAGGYGRQELYPFSDLDLLIICDEPTPEIQEKISQFITFLWDLGIEIGHAVRTLQETKEEALADITTATNLLEARLITGNKNHFLQVQNYWKEASFWNSQNFYQAKLAEQKARHKNFQGTLYQLEPNIKESPGGLRDIQTLYWIAKRHFNQFNLRQLVETDFITPTEYRQLNSAYRFISKIRFKLHLLKKRKDDRLTFDNQQQLAQQLNYQDKPEQLAVEQFMSDYYRHTKTIISLNELVLQNFHEDIYPETHQQSPINARFQLTNNYLETTNDKVFEQNHSALFELFILLAHYPEIKGVRANTLRLIKQTLEQLDENYRQDPINKELFIAILRHKNQVHSNLRRMHNYGLLGAFIPEFARITGLMQFNIFHAYTVDEHTLLTLRYLRRFFNEASAYEHPTAHQITKNLPKPELLYLAGLFHDLGKGKQGAHEVIGALEAEKFTQELNLTEKDSQLVTWLVRNHLEMSQIAQRKDLSDPQVIQEFARFVENQNQLNYLYLLTVADIRATSSEVWNDWKNALLLELYNETTNALDKAQEIPKDKAKKALVHQEKAREQLDKKDLKPQSYQDFWNSLKNTDFFNQQNPAEISRITQELYNPQETSCIKLLGTTPRGASEILIYTASNKDLFAQITQTLGRLNLNIVEAKVYSTELNKTLALVYFLDQHNQPQTDEASLEIIQNKLADSINHPYLDAPTSNPSKAQRVKHFTTPTYISYSTTNQGQTELHLTTKDIPGLLARIGKAFQETNIQIHDAKVNTIGEKAEDTFTISNQNNQPLTEKEKEQLEETLKNKIAE